jgi:hypothetical protein
MARGLELKLMRWNKLCVACCQRIKTVTIYRRIFAAHWSDIGTELTAVMDDVKQEEPHHATSGNSNKRFTGNL